jgi:hypothetical protein
MAATAAGRTRAVHQVGATGENNQLFIRSVQLEKTINERRAALGRDPVYLTRYGRPLAEAITDPGMVRGPDDTGDGSCDSGWCMT